MKLGQIISYAVLVSILSPGVQAGSAGKCTISGPRYWLKSDTVDWSIKIGSGQSCIGDLGFRNVAIESASLAQAPKTGQITLLGSTFTYSATSAYDGKDVFAVAITGAIRRSRTKGSSTIRVTVFTTGSAQPAPRFRDHATAAVTAPNMQSAAPMDKEHPGRPMLNRCRRIRHGTGRTERHPRYVLPSIDQSSIVRRRPSSN